MLIIAITGMPGAGKSTAAKALEKRGMRRITMGDVIREEVKRRGLPPDERNTGAVMRELREQGGPGAVADLCLDTMRGSDGDVFVVDGVRSMAEVEVFRSAGKVLLLAIQASARRRFEFLSGRGRDDDPSDLGAFNRRDGRELSVGIGNAIALADEVLTNEHDSPEELGESVVKVVDSWLRSVGE